MKLHRLIALALVPVLVTACAGGASSSTIATSPGSSTLPVTTATNDTPYTCPQAQTSQGALDCTRLPLGDQKFSTSGAKAGYIYSCIDLTGSPAVTNAPWLNTAAGTYNMIQKIAVSGSHSWTGSFSANDAGSSRSISSNDLPVSPTTTGTFPIQASDPASQYDRNPNSIAAQAIAFTVPSNPTENAAPSCLAPGPIGITVTGVLIYDAFDAAGYDGVAREEQDFCHGHPDQSSSYHYHGWLQACVPDSGSATQNSSLLGYAADGFGIYGPWYDGKILTTADLDECHGTTSPVMWNGRLTTIYHYVSTYDFPYTLGCYRGTHVRI